MRKNITKQLGNASQCYFLLVELVPCTSVFLTSCPQHKSGLSWGDCQIEWKVNAALPQTQHWVKVQVHRQEVEKTKKQKETTFLSHVAHLPAWYASWSLTDTKLSKKWVVQVKELHKVCVVLFSQAVFAVVCPYINFSFCACWIICTSHCFLQCGCLFTKL